MIRLRCRQGFDSQRNLCSENKTISVFIHRDCEVLHTLKQSYGCYILLWAYSGVFRTRGGKLVNPVIIDDRKYLLFQCLVENILLHHKMPVKCYSVY